jgi:hypothetical protein
MQKVAGDIEAIDKISDILLTLKLSDEEIEISSDKPA